MRLVLLIPALLLACKPGAQDEDQGGNTDPGTPEPLALAIDSPGDGEFVDADSVDLAGTVAGQAGLWVDGAEQQAALGTWTATAAHASVPWPDSPLWPVLAHAEAADGQWLRARRTLLQTGSADLSGVVPDALIVRLTDAGLVQLRPLIDQELDGLDLGEAMASEDPATTFLGIDVYVTGGSVGALAVDLDFDSQGLATVLVVEDLAVDLVLDAGWLGTTDVTVYAEQVDLDTHLVAGAEAGALTITPDGTEVVLTEVSTSSFEDSTGLLDDVLNLFLSDTLAGMLEEELVAAVDTLLASLDELRSLPVGDLVLQSDFTRASHDADGLSLYADTAVVGDLGPLTGIRGSTPGDAPTPSGTQAPGGLPYGLGLWLDDDLISGLGAGMVATGLLEQDLRGDLGGLTLDTTLLGGFVEGFDQLPGDLPVVLQTHPAAVPVGGPGTGLEGEAARLHLGGLMLEFLVDQGDGQGEAPVMTVAVDAIVGITGDAETVLGVDVAERQATLVWTNLDATPEEVEPGLTSLVDLAVPSLVGDLLGTGGLLPSDLGGIGLAVVDSAPDGDRAALFLDLAVVEEE